MALIEPIDPSEFNLQPEPPTFGPLWQQFFSEVDGLDTPELAAAAAVSAAELAAIANSIDTPLTLASLSLDGELGLLDPPEMAHAMNNLAHADGGFSDVLSVTPREAFMPFPPDLLPPPELGGFTPTSALPPGATPPGIPPGTPGYPGGPGGPPVPGGPGGPYQVSPQVELRNESRPTATNFLVGDIFLLQVRGTPGGRVEVSSTFNGRGTPLVTMGTLDGNGLLTLRGGESQTDRGEWYESWYVNGQLASPVLHFFVN